MFGFFCRCLRSGFAFVSVFLGRRGSCMTFQNVRRVRTDTRRYGWKRVLQFQGLGSRVLDCRVSWSRFFGSEFRV